MNEVFYYTGLIFWTISAIYCGCFFISEVLNKIYKRYHFSKEFLTWYAQRCKKEQA